MSRLTVTYTDGARLTILQDAAPLYSPEAQAMLDVYSTLGVALVDNELNYMVAYVDAMVASGNYLLVDAEFIFSLAGVNALIDWKGSKVATNNGATFDINGATTNGVDQWINTNWTPSVDAVNYADNNRLFGAWAEENGSVNNTYFMATADSSATVDHVGLRQDPTTPITYLLLSSRIVSLTHISIGLYIADQNASDIGIFFNGVSSARVSNIALTLRAYPFFMGARNVAGVASLLWKGTLKTAIIGASIGFNQPQYNTDLRALLTGIGTI